MEPSPDRPRPAAPFRPRITLTLLAGLGLFVVATLVYVLPVLVESPPPGAIPDYTRERVMARLDGVVLWLLAGSLVAAAGLSLVRRRPR